MDVGYRTIVSALALDEFTIAELAGESGIKETTVRTVLDKYRAHFEIENTPSGKRGRQPQTWRLTASGRVVLEAIAKSIDQKFEGPRTGPPLRGPTSNPEFATADDFNAYLLEPSIDLLPRLVRHLIRRAPGITLLDIPTGEGIRLRGEDGKVSASEPSLNVPAGKSVWEFGAGWDPEKKADEDYEKRTKAPSEGVQASETTFVFVTLRSFPNKRRWASRRKKERVWHDVIALDATDLHGWVEGLPAVHTWVSAEMGLHPLDVVSIRGWFEPWCAETKTPIPPSVLLAGRDSEIERLRREALTAGSVLVRSNSKQESLAFIAAALLTGDETGPDGATLASALLVRTESEWRRLADSLPEGILVPDFAGANPSIATRRGLTVVLPLGLGSADDESAIALRRIDVLIASQQLVDSGVSREQADRVAREVDRNLLSFRRSDSVNPDHPLPGWVDTSPGLIAQLVLLGGWDAEYLDDQAAVTELTQLAYEDVERELRKLALKEDQPFVETGTEWQVSSPQDAFVLVRKALTRGDLERWQKLAGRIVLKPGRSDALPTREEMLEIAKGIRRGNSSALRVGIARAATLLGTFGEPGQVEQARRLVSGLLRGTT